MITELTFEIPKSLWLTSNRHIVNLPYRARLVRDLHQLAAATATIARLEPVKGQVHVHWTVRYPKGVRRDKGEASNAQPTTKALLDGLVPTWLTDDGPQYVVAETFQRGPNLDEREIHTVRLVMTPQEVPW
ncbi:hypothetical protein EDD33_2606 [Nocardioides aurantiacus]|uniref:Uncharacterized protein n=2 Tax=Nocardioides aurantiacus TaxID=86796 RepID=A0A3N2CW18_9ACTN|nr:hypothetical protein EDD33_2606 [Nocardioides aurantiacus]